jgi:hypothetical protein
MFKGKYMYKWNKNGNIELEVDEYDMGYSLNKGVLNSQEGIKFTEEETPIELQSNQRVEFTRKQTPIFTGVLNYFPDAIREVARCSYAGQQQHNPDKPLAWDRSKSGDELDALSRHLLEAGTIDTDGIRHSAKVAWRALANLQKEIENENK